MELMIISAHTGQSEQTDTRRAREDSTGRVHVRVHV